MRPLAIVFLFASIGSVLALVIYRIVFGEPIAPPEQERTIDALIIFLSILLNSALAMAAAGVVAAMLLPKGSQVAAAAAGALVAGLIAAAMMVWFTGLSALFPVVMIAAAFICFGLARLFGLIPKGAA